MEITKNLEGSILLAKTGIQFLKIEDIDKISVKEKEHIEKFNVNRTLEFNGMNIYVHPRTKVFYVYYGNEDKAEYLFFEHVSDVMGRTAYCVLNRKGRLEFITRDGNKKFKEIIFE